MSQDGGPGFLRNLQSAVFRQCVSVVATDKRTATREEDRKHGCRH